MTEFNVSIRYSCIVWSLPQFYYGGFEGESGFGGILTFSLLIN